VRTPRCVSLWLLLPVACTKLAAWLTAPSRRPAARSPALCAATAPQPPPPRSPAR